MLIEIENLEFSYEKGYTTINGINLCVQEKGVHTILGHNGAGKSTLFKLILGLIKYKNGSISINKNLIKSKRKISYMPEKDGIYSNLTVYENMNFKAKVMGISKEQIDEKITGILKVLRLNDRRNSKVNILSNGLKKRAALACAIIGSPKMIILDEPTNSIDPESLNVIINVLRKLSERGISILISTHDLNFAKEVSTDITIINKGKIVYHNSSEDLPENFKDVYLSYTKEAEEYFYEGF